MLAKISARTWTGKQIAFPYHFIALEGCRR